MSLFYNKKLSFTTRYFYIDFNDNNNLLKLCKPCSDVMSKIIMTACIWLFVSPVLKFYNCVGNKYVKKNYQKIYKSKCFCWLPFYLPCIGGWPPGGGYCGSERGNNYIELKKYIYIFRLCQELNYRSESIHFSHKSIIIICALCEFAINSGI